MRAIRKDDVAIMIDYSKIGARIKEYRNRKGLSQEALAVKVSVDYRHIASIENGRKYPSLELVILIANALEVSADDILIDVIDCAASKDELHSLMIGCSNTEASILIKTLKFTKELFSEFGI